MTVSSETYREDYTGNASTVEFAVSFYFLLETELKVYLDGVLKTLTTHYTVTGAGNPAGGAVTFLVAPGTDVVINILRGVSLKQLIDYIENDTFPAESHEKALDKLTMIAQQMQEQIDRAVISPVTSDVEVTLPTPDAGKALLWNVGEDNLENSTDDFNDIVTDATAEKDAAVVAKDAAVVAQGAAETAETNAETAETGALAAEAKAEKWAEEVEDTPVESGKYSALHWAAKALAANNKGGITGWLTGTPPSGWLECDGASLLRTTYADLFAIIGVTYGNVDGTHFNLPDFRGEFLRGWDNSAGVDPDAASRTDRGDGTTGDNVGTKQAEDLLAHNHDITATGGGASVPRVADATAASATSSTLIQNTGGNETRPINTNVMWIIKY